MENVINIFEDFYLVAAIKVFSLYQKHCFPGLKMTNFYLYDPDLYNLAL